MRNFASTNRFACTVFVVVLLSGAPGWGQTGNAPSQGSNAVLEGAVRDTVGKPISGATVSAEDSQQNSHQVTTNANGEYVVAGLTPGKVSVRAQKSFFSRSKLQSVVLQAGQRTHLDFTLTRSTTASATDNAIQMDDTTHFTVAGITDWTAAGGHGSDNNLRASEALARETRGFEAPAPLVLNHVQESESALRAAVAREPKSFAANHALGEFYLSAHHEREAIAPLRAAFEINPADYQNSYQLALAYEMGGDLPQARNHLRGMLAKQNGAELHRLLADVDEKLDNPLDAERNYEEAAKLDASEPSYFAWGAELLLHRAVQPAIEVFGKGVEAHPDSERMRAGLGAALYASGLYDKAAEQLCKATDLNASDPMPYRFLGKMEEAAPRPLPCAAERLKRFAENQPNDAEADYYYALALRKESSEKGTDANSDRALALFQKAIRIDPKFADAYLQLGILWAARGDINQAIANYEKAIRANPNLAEAHFRVGQLYRRTGKLQASAQELKTYEGLRRTQAAAVEQQRRDLQQFVIVYKQPTSASP